MGTNRIRKRVRFGVQIQCMNSADVERFELTEDSEPHRKISVLRYSVDTGARFVATDSQKRRCQPSRKMWRARYGRIGEISSPACARPAAKRGTAYVTAQENCREKGSMDGSQNVFVAGALDRLVVVSVRVSRGGARPAARPRADPPLCRSEGSDAWMDGRFTGRDGQAPAEFAPPPALSHLTSASLSQLRSAPILNWRRDDDGRVTPVLAAPSGHGARRRFACHPRRAWPRCDPPLRFAEEATSGRGSSSNLGRSMDEGHVRRLN